LFIARLTLSADLCRRARVEIFISPFYLCFFGEQFTHKTLKALSLSVAGALENRDTNAKVREKHTDGFLLFLGRKRSATKTEKTFPLPLCSQPEPFFHCMSEKEPRPDFGSILIL
jgi:hypothetical protein